MSIFKEKYKYIFILLFLFVFNYCHAQHEYDHWVVPNQPDYEMNFLCDSVSLNGVDSIYSNVITDGATMCNKQTGQILFFTDGEQVWNSNFQQMSNGNGLHGGDESAQPALIVPLPGSDNIFYLFTADLVHAGLNGHGLQYSIVDMTKDGGLGNVTVKNIFLDSSSQYVTAVYNVTNNSFWVIACNYVTDNFMAFLVDSNGLDTTPILSPVHVKIHLPFQVGGDLRGSPNGENIVDIFEDPPIIGLYNFDKNTGLLSLKTFLPLQANDGQAVGASFSPDNSKLYISAGDTVPAVSNNSEIYQYTVAGNDTNAIKSSRLTIDSINSAKFGFAEMQLGPDGKIYIDIEYDNYLDVIEKTDSTGNACDFIFNKIPIPVQNNSYGIANNIVGLYDFASPGNNIKLSYSVSCNEMVSFKINTARAYDYFQVNFGDGKDTLLANTQYTFTHQYSSAGTYTVKLNTASGCNIQDSVSISVIVDTAKCPVPPSPLTIPTLIYGHGNQTQWQIINLPQGNNSVILYDELGRILYKTTNYPNNYDMRNLPPAMYFYRLTLESGQEYVGKILVLK